MTEPDLQLLQRLIREMQADMRTIRSEASIWQQQIRSEIASANINLVRAIGDRIAQFEAHLETRLDQTERSVEERLTRIEDLLKR